MPRNVLHLLFFVGIIGGKVEAICEVPGQAVGVTVNNYQLVNSLVVNWKAPTGNVSNYNVTITGDVNRTLQNTSTQVTFTNLLPGRNYTSTVQTISGSCNSPITTVTAATYPTPPRNVTFITIGANTITLSWVEPMNMTGVIKSYNITYYWNASSHITVTSNSSIVTLPSLKSGHNYTITVVTVGVQGTIACEPATSLESDFIFCVLKLEQTGWLSELLQIQSADKCHITIYSYSHVLITREFAFDGNERLMYDDKYPTPPGKITFITTGRNTITLCWIEPVNMTNVTYNITYYWNVSSPITVKSNSPNITLLSLKSGSHYTITVVTVGDRGYLSTPVSRFVFTQPLPVNLPQYFNVTSTSVSLNWTKPNEYQSSYTYRVQTNVTSSSTLIKNIMVTNQPATIVNLTPGQTYTFLIYTRTADNVTESDSVSLTTCTVPGQAVTVKVHNDQSVNSLEVNWAPPIGIVSNYNVTITGDVNRTLQNTSTQVTFTDLLPGRNYTVTVQTISGSCNSPITTVTATTYPTPPGNVTFTTIGTNTTTLSWVEPVNMTGVPKSYNITYYWNADSHITVLSNSPNATLRSLKSGSNYTITVVTVGARGYQSIPVSRSVFTKPLPVNLPQTLKVTSSSVSLNWSRPNESHSSYTYRVQTNVTSQSMINNTIVTSESASIVNLTPGQTYTFLIYTRAADNVSESEPVSLTTCTDFTVKKSASQTKQQSVTSAPFTGCNGRSPPS
ncbi:receptor-type tyrosine-protein phosphatase eta-like [Lithobates pipiens]